MQDLSKSFFSVILLSLFILAQGLMLVPHHHHESDALPCFSITHCADDCHHAPINDNDVCCEHRQDNTTFCNHRVDVLVDVRPPHLPHPSWPTDLFYAIIPDFSNLSSVLFRQEYMSSDSLESDAGNTPGSTCVVYLVVAHTPRTDFPYNA